MVPVPVRELTRRISSRGLGLILVITSTRGLSVETAVGRRPLFEGGFSGPGRMMMGLHERHHPGRPHLASQMKIPSAGAMDPSAVSLGQVEEVFEGRPRLFIRRNNPYATVASN